MIMSEDLQRKNARWLQVCVLLLAAVVLPLSVAYAQDSNDKTEAYLNQVWAKLQAEVEAGNMSAEDAEAKMTAIEEQCAVRAKTGAYFEQVWDTLQAQVEAGNLTAEDAETMMAAVKKKYADQANRAKYEAAAVKIRAAIAAGEITAEQGREQLAAFRESLGKGKRREMDWDGIKRRIEHAVETGEMTREEADAKYREIKARISRGDRGKDLRAKYDAAATKIRAAVESGEITAEQGRERLAAFRESLGRSDDGTRGRIIRALMENGIAREQIEGVMGTLRPIIGEIQREGDAFELDPQVREQLEGMGLTGEQIELVQGLARRIAYGLRDSDR